MTTMVQYKCPNCGGSIEYNTKTGKIQCPYCDSIFDAQVLDDYALDLDLTQENDVEFNENESDKWTNEEASSMNSYICKSCGSEVVTDMQTAATTCPFCGNAIVFAGKLTGELKPDYVVPFNYNKQQAKEAYANHFKNKPMVPAEFKDTAHLDEIKGVYVPFWMYDANVNTAARFRATRTRHYSDRDWDYVDTSYYSVFRSASMTFDNVPSEGSSKVDRDMMESLEPFDMSKAVDFNTGYLAGYFADKYDISAEMSAEKAYYRIKNSATEALESTVRGYDSIQVESKHVDLFDNRVKYCLLPVWLLVTDYKGKKFVFAMNGQTGKFVGDLPTDKGKFWSTFFKTFFASGIVYALIQVAIMLLG